MKKKAVAIYGAGKAGKQLKIDLSKFPEYEVRVMIDDNPLSCECKYDIPLVTFFDFKSSLTHCPIDVIFVAIPSLNSKDRSSIINKVIDLSIDVKVIPSLSELLKSKITVADLRDINYEDLLGRESSQPNEKLLKMDVFNKCILITGAGGSIGSELSRTCITQNPQRLF